MTHKLNEKAPLTILFWLHNAKNNQTKDSEDSKEFMVGHKVCQLIPLFG